MRMQATQPTRQLDELTARALAARHGDLEAYAKAVHDYDFEPYQPAWAEALATSTWTLIVCPPDSYKSTTVRMFVEQLIGRNPEISILWLMNAGAQSEKHVMSVAQTLKNNLVYRKAFPGIEPDNEAQWNKSVLYVKRKKSTPDPTLMATGLNGPYQGLHFDLIVIDDPTDQKDVNSPTTMQFQEQMIRGVVMDRLLVGGRIVTILTRWGTNDLVPVFIDMGFDVYQMPLVADYPWGPTISPSRFSLEAVEKKRQIKGDALFQMTYMCNPEAASGSIIRRDHIQYWDKPPDNPLQFFVGVDPAASLRTLADNAAIATVGIDIRTRKIFQTDIWADRLEVPDLELEIVRRCGRVAGLRGVGLETAGFQVSLLQSMRRKYNLPFKEIPYRTRKKTQARVMAIDRDKVGRAMYLDSLFTSNRLYLARNNPAVRGVSLETELCSIGSGRGHDDRMDALAFACVLAEASLPRSYRRIGIRAF